MMRHMMSAPMCTESLAAWKMMVLAASIVRAKHFASIPGRSPELSYGPTSAHSGIGTVSHIVWKLPKDITGGCAGGLIEGAAAGAAEGAGGRSEGAEGECNTQNGERSVVKELQSAKDGNLVQGVSERGRSFRAEQIERQSFL